MGGMVNSVLLGRCDAKSLGMVAVAVLLVGGRWVSNWDGIDGVLSTEQRGPLTERRSEWLR